MATTLRSNKKVVLSLIAVVAAALIGLVCYSPLSAIALQSNGTSSNEFVPYQGSAKPTISGTINIPQLIQSQVKVSFSDAAKTAAGNGTVIAGHLGVVQGYLVYTFTVMTNNTVHKVIVDAGNGTVLYQSPDHPANFGHGFAGQMAKHRFGTMMQHSPSTSGATAPGWVQTQY